MGKNVFHLGPSLSEEDQILYLVTLLGVLVARTDKHEINISIEEYMGLSEQFVLGVKTSDDERNVTLSLAPLDKDKNLAVVAPLIN